MDVALDQARRPAPAVHVPSGLCCWTRPERWSRRRQRARADRRSRPRTPRCSCGGPPPGAGTWRLDRPHPGRDARALHHVRRCAGAGPGRTLVFGAYDPKAGAVASPFRRRTRHAAQPPGRRPRRHPRGRLRRRSWPSSSRRRRRLTEAAAWWDADCLRGVRIGIVSPAVACLSGLKSAPRKRVRVKPPRVQIPPPPPVEGGEAPVPPGGRTGVLVGGLINRAMLRLAGSPSRRVARRRLSLRDRW